jgi:hypothetical protein
MENDRRERLEEGEPSRWNRLVPEEILLYCFSFLSPKDLARLATVTPFHVSKFLMNIKVCRRWKRISDSEVLWKHHLLKIFPRLSTRLKDGSSAKEIFAKFKCGL